MSVYLPQDEMEARGLEPMATLHHFVHPLWFEQLGGWAVEANIPLFTSYCSLIYRRFGHRLRLLATFNEPAVFAFMGYVTGMWAPGRRAQFGLAGRVLLNMLIAHTAAYRAIKAMPVPPGGKPPVRAWHPAAGRTACQPTALPPQTATPTLATRRLRVAERQAAVVQPRLSDLACCAFPTAARSCRRLASYISISSLPLPAGPAAAPSTRGPRCTG